MRTILSVSLLACALVLVGETRCAWADEPHKSNQQEVLDQPARPASGKVHVQRHLDEAPSWAIRYGKEFWRQSQAGAATVPLARSATPAGAARDCGEVIQRVSLALQAGGDSVATVDADTFVAAVDASGISFSPHRPSLSGEQPIQHVDGRRLSETNFPPAPARLQRSPETKLTLRTISARRGARTFLSTTAGRGDWSVLGNTAQALLSVPGALVEHVEVRRQGVEVAWVLGSMPGGAGDLQLDLEVTGLTFLAQTASGAHFADATGRARVCVGAAKFADSAGRTWPVATRVEGARLSLIVPDAVIAAASYPAAIDPLISPEFGLDAPVFLPVGAGQYNPDAAWNGSEFMVVWMDERNYGTTAHDIYGARVSAIGQVLDPAGIAICTSPYTQEHPRVASDGTNFFAVWADRRLTGDMSDIYGARISANGQVLDPTGIVICNEGWWDATPAIAFNGTNYLAVWDDQRNDSTPPRWRDIYGTRISPAGVLLDPWGIPIKTGPDDENAPSVAACGGDFLVAWHAGPETIGTYFHIYAGRITGDGAMLDAGGIPLCTVTGDQYWPDVGSDGHQFLVAWLDNRNATTAGDIYATRVTTNGLVLEPDGVPVCTTAGGGLPTVARQGTNFLVLWADSRAGNSDLYQARMAPSGTVLDPDGTPLYQGPGDQSTPRMVQAGDKSFLVWTDSRTPATGGDVYAALLTPGEAVASGGGFPVCLGLRADEPPVVASLGSEFLVVWPDRRDADTNGLDLIGTRISATGTLLDPAGIAICTAPGDQTSPAITAGSGQYFLTWADGRATQTDIYGTRITAAGTVLDPDGIAICSATGDQRQPDVAACGSNYFVTWFDLRNSSAADLYLGRVRADGAVLDGSGRALGTTLNDGPQIASDGDDVLAVWVRSSGRDLVARRFDASAQPIGADLTLAPASPNAPASPAVAGGPSGYLVAWRDQRNYAASQNDIFAARVERGGALLDPVGFPVSTATNHQIDPRVAANAGNYLVAWTDYRDGVSQDIYAARITGAGTVLDGVGFAVNTGTNNQRFPRVAYSADADVFLVASQSDCDGAFRTVASVISAPDTPPAFTLQPMPQYANFGETATFIVAAAGPPPLTYQWFFGSNLLAGATTTQLTITNATDADIGAYWVTVSNLSGVATSTVTWLYVDALPNIVTNPARTTVFAGTDVTLQVSAVGSPPLRYQWRFETAPLPDATNATLTLANVQFTNQGNYDVIVTNRHGGARSPAAPLTVLAPPYITAQPQSQWVGFGTNVTFEVEAFGSAPLGYQWSFHDSPLTDATNATLTVSNVLANHAGNYAVVVNNLFGSVTSAVAVLAVTSSPPVIIGHPGGNTVTKGAEIGFSLAAIGTSPLAYQWLHDGDALAGATSKSLRLTNTPYAAAGGYSAVVTNIHGSATTAVATLVVTNPPGFLWARQANATAASQGNAAAMDAENNVIVAGQFTGLITLGETNVGSAGSSDALLAKYDSNGNLLWVWRAGEMGTDTAQAVAVATNGDVLVAGRFSGTVDFGGVTLTARGSGDAFLARLDRDGHLLWAQQGGGTSGADTAYAVAVDGDGNALMVGAFDTSAIFGATTIYAASSTYDGFVAKYDLAGNVLWARRGGGTGDDQVRAVAADAAGSVFIGGYFYNSATFGTNTLSSNGTNGWTVVSQNSFLAKLDSAGNFLWASQAGGAGTDTANGLAVDRTGNVFLAGTYASTTNLFPGGIILSNTSSGGEAFLAKYSNNGTLLWARSAGGSYNDTGTAVALDPNGNAYLTGYFGYSAKFGGVTISGNYANAFVAAYGTDGTLAWVRASQSMAPHTALGLAVDDQGGVFTTGHFLGNASFGHVGLSSDATDFFLAKLAAFDPEAAPVIFAQPLSQSVIGGANLTLTAGVMGGPPLSFQWLLNGTNLLGATNATLTWPVAVGGSFALVVSNASGSATSAVAVIMVTAAPDFLWTLGFGGTSNDAVTAVAINPSNGDLFVAGYFTDTFSIAGTNLVSAGAEDIFIAKFDSNRALVWVKQAGGPGADRATALALDGIGRVYVAGTFSGAAQFDWLTITSAGGTDTFFWCMEADGTTRWRKRGGGSGNDFVSGIAVDASGSAAVCGTFQQSATFEGFTLNSAGPSTTNNCFLLRYSPVANLMWAKGGTGSRDVLARGVALDPDGNAYVCGGFAGTANFSSKTVISLAGLDVFLAKYNSVGDALWVRRAGTMTATTAPWDDEGLAIATDAGGFVVAGTFTGTAQFGGNTLFSVATNQPNTFVARFDTNGATLWASQTRGRLAQSARALALDAAGNSFIAGTYSDAASFGAEVLPNAGGSEAFVAMFDTTGRLVKVRRAGGVGNDAGLGICADQGRAYVAGSFSVAAAFGADLLTSAGGTDGFVTALAFFDTGSAPAITTSPRSKVVPLVTGLPMGSNAFFTVGAQGAFPLSYQWRQNGADLANATNADLFISPVPLSSVGAYSVVVSNVFGAATSSPAMLTLDVPLEFVWARRTGGTLDDTGYVASVDVVGNVCLAGSFSGTASFGSNTLVSAGGTDGFVAKCDAAGNFLWASRLTGTGNDVAVALATDAAGSVCVAGHFASPIVTLGSLTATNTRPTFPDIFVAKLSSNGTPLWLRRAGAPATDPLAMDQASAITTDSQGNVLVTGFYSDRASFGSLGITNANCTNFFLAKYDPNGTPLWVTGPTGSSKSQGAGVTVASDGSIYVTGSYRGAPNFGGITLTNSPGSYSTETIFLAKYSPDGVVQWAKVRDGLSTGFARTIFADPSGSIYLSAYKSDYGLSPFLARYDPLGNQVWSFETTLSCCTGDSVTGNGLTLDETGNLLVAGTSSGYGYLSTNSANFVNGQGFLAKFRPDGTLLTLTGAGKTANGLGNDRLNAASLVGGFSGTMTFGTAGSLTSTGGKDIFVAKLGVRPATVQFTTTNRAVVVGSSVVLSVSAAGTAPLEYQWQLNGTNVPGGYLTSLTLASFAPAQAGTYSVIVRNPAGSVTNTVAVLTAIPVLNGTRAGDALVLSWLGDFMLQTATNLAGPFVDAPGVVSPFTNALPSSAPQLFFRLRSNL